MRTRIKQLFGLTRYFIVAYQYQLMDGVTGQGSMSALVSGGAYINVDEIVEILEPKLAGKVKAFLVLNVIELNKRDHAFYKENYTLSDKTNEKL